MEKITIDSKLVKHVAYLARLELKEEELEKFTGQLSGILDYMEKMQALDTQSVSPTSHAMPLQNVFREDKVTPSLSVEEALKNAPAKEGNFFKVPKVIEQE